MFLDNLEFIGINITRADIMAIMVVVKVKFKNNLAITKVATQTITVKA